MKKTVKETVQKFLSWKEQRKPQEIQDERLLKLIARIEFAQRSTLFEQKFISTKIVKRMLEKFLE